MLTLYGLHCIYPEPIGFVVSAMRTLAPIVNRYMKKHDTLDVYEQYLDVEALDHCFGPPSAKGLTVLRYHSPVKSTATSPQLAS